MDAQLFNTIQGRKVDPIIPVIPIIPLPSKEPSTSSSSESPTDSASASSSASASTTASETTSISASSASVIVLSSSTNIPSETPVVQPSVTPTDLPSSQTSSSAQLGQSSRGRSTVFQTVTPTGSEASTSPSSTSTAVATQNTGFLQNKVLSGVVFGVGSFIGLVLLVFLATCMLRRRRNKRLINEAVAFDPVNFGKNDYPDMMETGLGAPSGDVRSTSSQGSHAHGPLVAHSASFSDYAPPPSAIYLNSAPSSPRTQQYFVEQPPPSPYAPSYRSSAQQPYGQSANWAAGTGQPPAPPYYNGPPQAVALPEVDRHVRRSRSSSTELKFAAIAPHTPEQSYSR